MKKILGWLKYNENKEEKEETNEKCETCECETCECEGKDESFDDEFDFDTLYKNERIALKDVFDTISKNIETNDIINKLTENEKYYIKLHIDNNKNIRSINTNWDEFENNKKLMKDIRKTFDEKTNYIMLYLQVVLQNDKNTLSILENL